MFSSNQEQNSHKAPWAASFCSNARAAAIQTPFLLFQGLRMGEGEPSAGWSVVGFCPFTSLNTDVTSLAELTHRVLPCSFLRGVRAQKIEQKCRGTSFIFKRMNKRIFLESWELRMLGISLPWPFFHLIISCQALCPACSWVLHSNSCCSFDL